MSNKAPPYRSGGVWMYSLLCHDHGNPHVQTHTASKPLQPHPFMDPWFCLPAMI